MAEKNLTREQWAEIEQKLSSPYGGVELLVDGYRLYICVVLIKPPLTYGLAVYINGWMKGEWLLKDCEERRRFHRETTRYLFSARKRSDFIKKHGIRAYKRFDAMSASFKSYSPHWPSVGALRRHLVKHNQSIELAPTNQPEASA